MDEKILLRINSLLGHIDDVLRDTSSLSLADFKKSDLLLRATCFSITQIGEQRTKLETYLGSRYPHLPWKAARNMRNIIVHDYGRADADQIFQTIKNDLPVLKTSFLSIKDDLCKESD